MADLERDRGSQGLTPCKEGPPRMPPHPRVCHLRLILLAVECRLKAHSAWRSPAAETRPAHCSRAGAWSGLLQLPWASRYHCSVRKCQVASLTRTPLAPSMFPVPSTDPGTCQARRGKSLWKEGKEGGREQGGRQAGWVGMLQCQPPR